MYGWLKCFVVVIISSSSSSSSIGGGGGGGEALDCGQYICPILPHVMFIYLWCSLKDEVYRMNSPPPKEELPENI
jgi:hypothetical protein